MAEGKAFMSIQNKRQVSCQCMAAGNAFQKPSCRHFSETKLQLMLHMIAHTLEDVQMATNA
jgi:hypothetical protein